MQKIAIDLNNAACSFIDKGLYFHATQTIQYAVKALLSSSIDKSQMKQMNSILNTVNRKLKKLNAVSPTKSLCEDDEISFVRQQPLLLNAKRYHQNNRKVKIMCTYNLALATHLRYLEERNSSSPTGLKNALKMYKWVYRQISLKRSDSMYYILSLTILNNMGQIHHILVQYKEAEECFSQLSNLIDQHKSCSNHRGASEYFQLNISTLRRAQESSPAA